MFFRVLLASCILLFSGCSILNLFQGSFGANDWEIQKIVVQNKEYLGLQGMKNKALKMLGEQNQVAQEEIASIDTSEEGKIVEQEEKMSIEDLEELAQIEEKSLLSFDPKQNKIYGNAGCNNFSADYSWRDADNVEIYEVNITRKLCTPSSVMTFELQFARKLKGLFFVEKKGKDSLILKSKEMYIYLKSK